MLQSAPGPLTDDPYSRQLARGFAHLYFEQPLERQYRDSLAREQYTSAIICGIVTLVIWTGFFIFDFIRLDVANRGLPTPDLWALLLLRGAVLAVMVLVLCTPLRNAAPTGWMSFVVYVLVGVVAAVTAVIYKANALPAADIAQIVVIMAAFLPLGMRFYAALLAAVSLVIVTAVAGFIALEPALLAPHLSLAMIMALAVPVAAAGGYLREHAHRHQFLLNAVLSRQAQFDPLTDLANRRLFQHHFDATTALAARQGEPIVLAILDIDHFKGFNDRFGHAAGDQALVQVAKSIRSVARRPMDMASRLGGEEFALLLYGCDAEDAQPLLDGLRQSMATISPSQTHDALTVSIGATCAQPEESLSEVYDRADRLLYASKTNGRDRLSVG